MGIYVSQHRWNIGLSPGGDHGVEQLLEDLARWRDEELASGRKLSKCLANRTPGFLFG